MNDSRHIKKLHLIVDRSHLIDTRSASQGQHTAHVDQNDFQLSFIFETITCSYFSYDVQNQQIDESLSANIFIWITND